MDRQCLEYATRLHLKSCNEMDSIRQTEKRKTKRDMASDNGVRDEQSGIDMGTDTTIVSDRQQWGLWSGMDMGTDPTIVSDRQQWGLWSGMDMGTDPTIVSDRQQWRALVRDGHGD